MIKKFLFFVFAFSLSASAVPQMTSIEGTSLLTGATIQVDGSRRGLVIIFLSAKCPCSASHNMELRDLAQNYTDFSFVAVHSNIDEGKAFSKAYFEKAAFPFPVIQDESAQLADRLQALKTPHAFIFGSNGDLLYQGGVSNSKDCTKADRKFLREALEDLQAGKTVRTPEGRTLGCAISRGENRW